jgi:hypothetical protein
VQHSLPVRHGIARHLLVRVQCRNIVLDFHHLALKHLHIHRPVSAHDAQFRTAWKPSTSLPVLETHY